MFRVYWEKFCCRHEWRTCLYDPNDRINNYLNTEMVNIDDLELSDINNSEYNNDFKVSDITY